MFDNLLSSGFCAVLVILIGLWALKKVTGCVVRLLILAAVCVVLAFVYYYFVVPGSA